jgi:hypothetical protein
MTLSKAATSHLDAAHMLAVASSYYGDVESHEMMYPATHICQWLQHLCIWAAHDLITSLASVYLTLCDDGCCPQTSALTMEHVSLVCDYV